MESPEASPQVVKEAEVLSNYSLIKNIHVDFPTPAGSENAFFVREDYRYFHYGCDDFDDKGWGCGYRVLQTLCSWIDPAVPPLSLREMIAVVAEMDIHDTEKSGHGGRHIENPWIGTFEGFLIIDRVYDVSCRIDFVKSARELGQHLSVVRNHFATVGSPVFMGGDQDCFGKCIVGACSVGPLEYLLVLDPHYSGFLDSREEAYRKGCLKWIAVSDFLDESFYNLLMPLSHGSLKYRPVRCELYRSIGIAKGTIDKRNV